MFDRRELQLILDALKTLDEYEAFSVAQRKLYEKVDALLTEAMFEALR